MKFFKRIFFGTHRRENHFGFGFSISKKMISIQIVNKEYFWVLVDQETVDMLAEMESE